MQIKIYLKLLFFILIFPFLFSCKENGTNEIEKKSEVKSKDTIPAIKDYDIIVASFLGDEKRCYYGENPPNNLTLVWKCWLSGAAGHMPFHSGETNMRYGAGWTGQPLLFKNNQRAFLIQGSFDFNLRKIDVESGDVIWKYPFDDAIKGTGTLFYNKKSKSDEGKLIILQGGRQSARSDYNFRGVSAISGKELYRMQVIRTPSVSRDVDGSALVYGDTAYIGLENGIFKVFNPNDDDATKKRNFYEPEVYNEINLYSTNDLRRVGGNIVTESSPSYLNGRIYISAGSGHIYGYNISTSEIDWDFFVGADLNGSCVITDDNCILVSVEKQNIIGNGGMLKLDPSKKESDALVWYFSTQNSHLLSWDGGVIGSTAINDKYKNNNQKYLSCFTGIDGFLYVVDYNKIDGKGKSFDNKEVDKPELIFKYKIGSSISTPIIFRNKLIAAGYGGIYLFEFNENYEFKLIEHKTGTFEGTPIVYDNSVFIASKDGYLYRYGK